MRAFLIARRSPQVKLLRVFMITTAVMIGLPAGTSRAQLSDLPILVEPPPFDGIQDPADMFVDADTDELLALGWDLRELAGTMPSLQGSIARLLAARALVYARLQMGGPEFAEAEILAEAARTDLLLTTEQRFEAAALSDYVRAVQTGGVLAPDDARWERLFQGLAAEFPDQSTGYEALLGLALKQADSSEASRLARTILAMPTAPPWVRTRAQTLLNRIDLIGASVFALMPEDHGAESLTRGTPILIYSWVSWSPETLVVVERLIRNAPPGAALIGVNLQPDASIARRNARDHTLPGRQLYDPRGQQGLVAMRFMLDTPGLAILADKDGIILTVTAHLDATLRD